MTRRSAAAPLLLLFVPFLVLSVEGLFATVTDRSWIRKAIGLGRPLDTARSLVETMHLDDEERRRTALLSEGPYATSTDPWIGIEMKRSFHGELVGVPFSTDALGLRTRPGPPPEEGALRILLLGDSVAFGCGVADDESLGAVLEEELRRARPAARPAPVVLTAATLGWTVANARRWLLDHFADVEPDVVLHIVVGNDLDDGFSVLDGGLRSIDHDPVRGADRSPYVGYGFNLGYIGGLRYENRIRDVEHLDHLPVYALYAGITPESKRRWASVFADLEDLERRMRARGGHYIAFTVDSSSPFDQDRKSVV